MNTPITIGVSACLLGEQVRYDGDRKLDRYITDTLGKIFRFVAVCPEKECGLPVPREKMRLEGESAAPRLMTINTRIDMTEQMLSFCRNKVCTLENEYLCGFIFKKNSPSCEPFSVTVYDNDIPTGSGKGLFAATVASHFPLIPVMEEERLSDHAIREEFIEQVFSYRRRKDLLLERSPGI